jgi:threonylcarbamoyladenosine tRNA methylthiotransferase MtaB
MPQLDRGLNKRRAESLRAAGDAALFRHLAALIGKVLSGLVERAGTARADDFSEIRFEGEAHLGQILGQIVPMRITGHDGKRLTAVLV